MQARRDERVLLSMAVSTNIVTETMPKNMASKVNLTKVRRIKLKLQEAARIVAVAHISNQNSVCNCLHRYNTEHGTRNIA
jgi:hypothetical protein